MNYSLWAIANTRPPRSFFFFYPTMTYRKQLWEHDLCVQWCWIKHQREATGGGAECDGSSGRGFSPSLQSKAFDSFPENRSLQWKRASGLPTGTECRKTQCSKMGCWVTLMRWPLWREGDKETAKSQFPWFVSSWTCPALLCVCMCVCLCVCGSRHFYFLPCFAWVWVPCTQTGCAGAPYFQLLHSQVWN